MYRRAFLALGGTFVVAAAGAQTPTSNSRIAALLTVESVTGRANLAAFHERLNELGWTPGRNLQIDVYWAGEDRRRWRDYVAKLAQTRPDVIFSQGTIGMAELTSRRSHASRSVMWQATASYVDRILRGARPGELPVQEPTEPEIVVNLKTATTLGLTLPATILTRATRIIR